MNLYKDLYFHVQNRNSLCISVVVLHANNSRTTILQPSNKNCFETVLNYKNPFSRNPQYQNYLILKSKDIIPVCLPISMPYHVTSVARDIPADFSSPSIWTRDELDNSTTSTTNLHSSHPPPSVKMVAAWKAAGLTYVSLPWFSNSPLFVGRNR